MSYFSNAATALGGQRPTWPTQRNERRGNRAGRYASDEYHSASPATRPRERRGCGHSPCSPAIYVYWNPHGQIVIRRENWPDDDHHVFFSSEMIATLIARLKELAGLK